jgi:hypothetical protein
MVGHKVKNGIEAWSCVDLVSVWVSLGHVSTKVS